VTIGFQRRTSRLPVAVIAMAARSNAFEDLKV